MRRVERREQEKQKTKKKKNKFFVFLKGFLKFLFVCFLTLILVGVLAMGLIAFKLKPITEELWNNANEKVSLINEGTFKDKVETVIYDNKGTVIREVAVHDYYYIEDKDIKPEIKEAVIAIEDARYLEHKGYDVKGIARAFADIVKNNGEITQGGSTITQQLVKLQFLSLEKSYKRKIEEIFIATKIENQYSKEEILEFYLNNINYGNGAYGIETASRTYFSKPSKELTISEIAFLTAIPNNPSVYNPVRNMENTLKRRNIVLSEMKEVGFINEKELNQALKEVITLKMAKKKLEPETYEVSYVLSSATKILMEKEGFKFKYWFETEAERSEYQAEYSDLFTQLNQKIRNGGYSIYSTIDMDKQKMFQESMNKGLSDFTAKDAKSGLYKTQGAGALIDNNTGDLLAIIGGRTQDDVANTYNRAFLSYRQPGSSIKPLVAYTPAFERGMLASTIMNDTQIKNGPNNWDKRFHGKMTLRKATEMSWNTIPYQIMNRLGAKDLAMYLAEMEFSGLTPQDANAIIAVGGFTYGTTPLEMTAGYATLARNGAYVKPTGISKIVDFTNTTLYENERKSKRIYDKGSAYLMTDVLKGVVSNRSALAYGYGVDGFETAGKTGTTNGNRDKWYGGYTPHYTAVVWVGNDMPANIPGEYPQKIWKDFMQKVHKGVKPKKFDIPTDRISYMFVNPNTGEVSKQDGRGWWRQELVPEIYWELQEKRKADAKAKAERDKREKEKQRLEEIKRLLDDAGITQEEEEKLERKAEEALRALADAHIYSTYDYEYVYGALNEAKSAIEAVVLPIPRGTLYARYNVEAKRIELERKALEKPPEPERETETQKPDTTVEDIAPELKEQNPNPVQVPVVETPEQTKPVEPKPVEPKPVEPKPVQPKPVQPKPKPPATPPVEEKEPEVPAPDEGTDEARPPQDGGGESSQTD